MTVDVFHRYPSPDSMAFDTGIHFITMLTGLIRVAAFLADVQTAENQLVVLDQKHQP